MPRKNKKGWTYPVFDVEWRALGEVSKSAAYSSVYLNAIKSLVKEADTFTIATDFDVEGEVIGFNILRFLCKVKDARRMKFSTTTKKTCLKPTRMFILILSTCRQRQESEGTSLIIITALT